MEGVAEYTDQELVDLSGHLWYEIQMLFDTSDLVDSGQFAKHDVVRSALIQAFAIHARNLLDFFYGNHTLDDAHIELYLIEGSDWGAITAGIDRTELERIRRRANKEVAHLTFYRLRVSGEEKPWQSDMKLVKEDFVVPALAEFAKSANYRLLGPLMTDLLTKYKP